MRAWVGAVVFLALVGAVGIAAPAAADPLLAEGDAAPMFMLAAYNEAVASDTTGTNSPALGNFLGVSPEQPRDAVLLVFLDGGAGSAAELELLAKLQRKYATWGAGLQVLAICIDAQSGDMNSVLELAHSVNFPVLRDRFQVVADRYGVTAARVPVTFLLVGQRPDVALKPSEQAAIKEAYLSNAYQWSVAIVQRWSGSLLTQEASVDQALDSVLQP